MGIEPMTFCLQDRCSTTKLNRLLSYLPYLCFLCHRCLTSRLLDFIQNYGLPLYKNVKGDYGDRTHDLLFTRQMLYH